MENCVHDPMTFKVQFAANLRKDAPTNIDLQSPDTFGIYSVSPQAMCKEPHDVSVRSQTRGMKNNW